MRVFNTAVDQTNWSTANLDAFASTTSTLWLSEIEQQDLCVTGRLDRDRDFI